MDLQTLAINTRRPVRTLVIADAAAAHAIHATAGIALEVVGATLRRSEQTIVAARIAVIHVPVVALFTGIKLAVPAERWGHDAASGHAAVTGRTLLVQRTLPTAPLLA